MAAESLLRAVLRRKVEFLRHVRQRRAQPYSTKPPTAGEQIPTAGNVPNLPFWQRLGPLTRAAFAYARAQRKRPYTTQVATSLVIYLFSDISAQRMGGRDYDPKRTVRSLIIGSICSIPSFKWTLWLSNSFNYSSRILSLGTKVVVNQICFTPIFNSYFFGMQAFLAGESWNNIVERIRVTVPVSFVNSWKVWPAVTAISFTFIPMEYRSLFAGVVAVGWQTYLSFLNRKAEDGKAVEAPVVAASTQAPSRPVTMAAPYLRTRPALSAALRPLAPKPRLQSFPRRPNSTTTTTPTTTTTATPTESTKAAAAAAAADPSIVPRRLKLSAYAAALATVLGVGYYYATDTRASAHQYLVPPLLRTIIPDAEEAHHVGTAALKGLYDVGLHIRERVPEYPNGPLSVNVFGKQLLNPIGISAGLDKDAEIPDPLFALGAGVVEVGGCTPFPQEGNPKPRVFRIPTVDGLINRYGLNSRGADAMATRLRERLRKFARSVGLSENQVLNEDGTHDIPPGSLHPGRLLCVQIAKNKKTDEKDVNAVIRDYVYCVDKLAPYADVLVVNVSSPNTPGLRDLQATEPLTKLLSAVVDAAQATKRKNKPRVMVKVSPDEDDDTQMEGVVEAVWNSGVDGVIVGNTTKRRTGIIPPGVKLIGDEPEILHEDGGFSGPALFERTVSLVGRYRKMLDGYALKNEADKSAAQKVLFATGGITNGEQALKVLNAGASVAMVYTGMVYGGSGTITRIKTEMKEKLGVKSA
ncbi:hypothetical protein QBC32DRAFT_202477 [Pseudoneurospora amorphoporcata]|uniref:Dihydroorotate dehydrogenase catalytic domain-containing protein n=1 Tax=Pseudoneurospora amorphoporcata TaxID=241081 RepID=A0AAN6SKH1_9PEZI|nr:hypothetical protein QBC32DRAFT_202477 [Pseudoneurospora amorphoporcata]